jgi:hypothetical protein
MNRESVSDGPPGELRRPREQDNTEKDADSRFGLSAFTVDLL